MKARTKLTALAASAILLGGSAHAQDRVVFLTRHIAVVCAGVCPMFEVAVTRDGKVSERFFNGIDENNSDIVRRVRRFQVTRAAAANFFRELSPFRPFGRRQFGQRCYPEVPLDDPTINHELSEYEVHWSGGGPSARLDACVRDASVRRASDRALIAISIDPHSGRPLTREMRLWWKECVAETNLQRC